MAIQNTFPAIKPSLNLDFANTKQLDPRITFTRASTATYYDQFGVLQTAPAGVPRFDHDPVTGESLGFLIEEQRTNLLTYSEQFDNAAWTKSNATVTANTVVAPDGTLTGDKAIISASTDATSIAQAVSFSSNTTYALTVYAKKGELMYLNLGFDVNSFNYGGTQFDLLSGTVLRTGSAGGNYTLGTSTIESVGGGWYRCKVVISIGATAATFRIITYPSNTLWSSGYIVQTLTGDGTSGIYIWGAQLEAGAFPTSYIPTVASQVTRSADATSMTGPNFSSWFRADEGTLYNESRGADISSSTRTQLAVSDGTGNNRILCTYGTAFNWLVQDSGNLQAALANGVSTLGLFEKAAGAYKVNDFAVSKNSTAVTTDTLGSVPVVNRLYLGAGATGTAAYLNGTIKRLTYYPKRLSNTELQSITS